MYKVHIDPVYYTACCVTCSADGASIPFDPTNMDYLHFKSQINSGQAELQDAEGNLLSSQEAKAFVATLP